MKKADLVPMKHILITRNKNVYWYIGDELSPQDNVIACSSCLNRDLNETWKSNLLARRDEFLSSYEEPRNYDVIYIYEITHINEWLNTFHENRFIHFEEHIRRQYGNCPFVKQVYERLDGKFD